VQVGRLPGTQRVGRRARRRPQTGTRGLDRAFASPDPYADICASFGQTKRVTCHEGGEPQRSQRDAEKNKRAGSIRDSV